MTRESGETQGDVYQRGSMVTLFGPSNEGRACAVLAPAIIALIAFNAFRVGLELQGLSTKEACLQATPCASVVFLMALGITYLPFWADRLLGDEEQKNADDYVAQII